MENLCIAKKELSCVNEGLVSRCKRLWLSDRLCDRGTIRHVLQGARDPITGKAYISCWSDISLQTTQLLGAHYRLVLAPQSGNDIYSRCQALVGSAQEVTHSYIEISTELVRDDLLEGNISRFTGSSTQCLRCLDYER